MKNNIYSLGNSHSIDYVCDEEDLLLKYDHIKNLYKKNILKYENKAIKRNRKKLCHINVFVLWGLKL